MRKIILALILTLALGVNTAGAQSVSESDIDELIEYLSTIEPAPSTIPAVTNRVTTPTPTSSLDAVNPMAGMSTQDMLSLDKTAALQDPELLSSLGLGDLDINALMQEGSSGGALNPGIAIRLIPPHPQPGEAVKATINDYTQEVFGSRISWTLNGNVIPEPA